MDDNSSIGDFIKISRIQEGFKTQKQLSEVSGISQTTLSRIEAGTQKPQPDTLLQLSKYLHSATYGELMEKAGYLDGLPETDRAFMADFFNKHGLLDGAIENVIKSLSTGDSFSNSVVHVINSELKPLLDNEQIEFECTPKDIKQLIKELDPDIEFKTEIYKALIRAWKLSSQQYSSHSILGPVNLDPINSKVPLLGSIRAGLPILAEENWQEEIEAPPNIKADFALRVEGDSMIYAGILPGDIVLLKQSNTANTGDIIAAGVEDSSWSANLKYFVKPNGHYCLRSANPNYKDIEFTENHRIIGIMEGLIREKAPSVNEYKALMNLDDSITANWLDVIMEAQAIGLNAEKVRSLIDIQKSMFEQLSKNK
ncbi:MAG: helix-turn-helix domain-containing protein [Desulfitobacteriaceae bacterium]